MKLLVLVRGERVVATAGPKASKGGWHAGLVAGPGQAVRTIEVSDEDAQLPPIELHDRIESRYLTKSLDSRKLFVIVQNGRVVGTARARPPSNGWSARPIARQGQTIHEIELAEWEMRLEPHELHEVIESKYLKN